MNDRLVTVITSTVAHLKLGKCVESVQLQTYPHVQHLIFVDGNGDKATRLINQGIVLGSKHGIDIIKLPYSTGVDRFNGHRNLAAGVYLAKGDIVMFLDDDNTYQPNHIQDCVDMLDLGDSWTYSLRNIVNTNHEFICQDNCESLGKWASVLGPQDFFIDLNCYCLIKKLALMITPIMHRRFREPGQMEIDRIMRNVLGQLSPNFDCTYKYSVNYAVGNTPNSVQDQFFIKGNETMKQRYPGGFPWQP